jgi:hypothetical protein
VEQGDESGGEVVKVQTPIGALREGTAVQFRVALIDLAPKDLDADGGEDVVDQEEQEASPTCLKKKMRISSFSSDFLGDRYI